MKKCTEKTHQWRKRQTENRGRKACKAEYNQKTTAGIPVDVCVPLYKAILED